VRLRQLAQFRQGRLRDLQVLTKLLACVLTKLGCVLTKLVCVLRGSSLAGAAPVRTTR
jgi:hypothetical protein